jgi:hypothetical protein
VGAHDLFNHHHQPGIGCGHQHRGDLRSGPDGLRVRRRPTKGTAAGKTVTFAPLPSLAPKAQVTYKVIVKGNAAADARIKVSLTSDMIDSPVEETESTHIY